MNQNRGDIRFDSDVETDSLRDALWRLTTRVYLLEDFIADKFGETVCPSGYKKSDEEPSTSFDSANKVNNKEKVEIPPVLPRSRRGRKRKIPIVTNEHKNAQKRNNLSSSTSVSEEKDPKMQTKIDQVSVEVVQECSDGLLVPKDEMDRISENEDDDNFLNDDSEDDDVQKDPDFILPKDSDTNEKVEDSQVDKAVSQQNTSLINYTRKFTSQIKNKITYKLARNGYSYGLRRTVKGTNYWYCVKRKECSAAILEKGEVFKEGKKGWSGSFHASHPPNDKTVIKELVRGSAKKIALENPDKSKCEILDEVTSNLPVAVQSVISNEDLLKKVAKK